MVANRAPALGYPHPSPLSYRIQSSVTDPRRSAIDKHNPAKIQSQRQRAREVAIALAKVASDTRCTNVVVLDVSGISPITDFFVLGTGTSPRQMRTVADDCIEAADVLGYKPMSATGAEGSSWICLDLIDVVVHIFSEESRVFYDLDNLWADARKIDWQATGK